MTAGAPSLFLSRVRAHIDLPLLPINSEIN